MHCKDTTYMSCAESAGLGSDQPESDDEDVGGYWGEREDLVEETIAGLKARFALDELQRIAGMLALEVDEKTVIPKRRTQISGHECWIRSWDNPVHYTGSVGHRKGGTRCLYDMDSDMGDDACIFCGEPYERK